MSKKVVKLTRGQLERIVEHIENNKSVRPIGFLTEEVLDNKEVIEEGWKDIVLATALLIGVGLTGQNKAQAQTALKSGEMIDKIEAVLSSDKISAVIDSLEAAGLDNAEEKVQNNAERIENRLNDRKLKISGIRGGLKVKHGKRLKTTNVNNYNALAKKLKAGYAITDITQDTIQQIVTENFPTDPVIDSLQVIMDAGDLFTTGAYTLSSDADGAIQSYLDQIRAQDGVIIGVTIESSTDFERIDMGNDKLADLRAEAIEGAMSSKVPSDLIDITTLPNNGPDVYSSLYEKYEDGQMSASEFKTERDSLREETSQYRYVKIIIDVIKVVDDEPEDTVIETIEDVIIYNFELAKVYQEQFKITWPKFGKGKQKTKQAKCNTDCPVWGKNSKPKVGGQEINF